MQALRASTPNKVEQAVENQRSVSRRAIPTFSVLAALAFGPSAIRYVLETSSMAVGLGAICAGLFIFGFIGLLTWPKQGMSSYLLATAALIFAIAVHLVITTLWFSPDYGRAFLSLMLLFVSMLGSVVCATTIFSDELALERALYWMCSCFLLIALFGLVGLSPPSGLASERPLFPFTEPSHFALTFMPFLAFVCVRVRGHSRYAILIAAAIFAYFIKSLSLIIGLVILGAVLLPLTYAALLVGIALLVFQYVDLAYFSERVDLSQETTNLSALIYRQGWELVQQSFHITNGVGIGFQQLGVAPVSTPTSDIIYRLLREDSNLQDAGFTAAKVISEFGIFGMIAFAGYVYLLLISSIKLRKDMNKNDSSFSDIFAYCAVIGYTVEFFVRGLGYFSGTTVFVMASIIHLSKSRLQ